MGISTMWLHFQSFPLLYTGRKCYAEASLRVSGREDLSSKSVVCSVQKSTCHLCRIGILLT